MIHLLAVGYQHWCSLCSPAFVAIADSHVPAAGSWHSGHFSFPSQLTCLYFLQSSLQSHYSQQLDFLIPSECHDHWEIIYLSLGNICNTILKWKNAGSNWNSFYFLISQHTTITNTKFSKHVENWSFLVLNIPSIWPQLPSSHKRGEMKRKKNTRSVCWKSYESWDLLV